MLSFIQTIEEYTSAMIAQVRNSRLYGHLWVKRLFLNLNFEPSKSLRI